MEASYVALRNVSDVLLGVVTIYKGAEIKKDRDASHTFYLIPSKEHLPEYDSSSSYNQNVWRWVINDFKPDLIQIWGTEFAHGLCALKVAGDIPSVVYIQGMMKELYHHSFDGMDFCERLKSTTPRSIIKHETYWSRKKRLQRQAEIEAAIITRSQNVIVESDWCAAHCLSIANGCKVFKSLLPINRDFYSFHWSADRMEPHSIFTSAGVNTIKGHHILIKALAIIKRTYPDVKVYEPGENYYYGNSFRRRIMRDSYISHILSLEKECGLEGSIIRVGRLTPKQMGEYMEKCNVFVMSSVIENHSSTLIEAMMVGVPCVTSYVGGISDYLHDGVNGYFYRSDEPEMLAYRVMELFADRDKCISISNEARESTIKARCTLMDLTQDFKTIYSAIVR